jgi:antitoxin MazE
MLYRPSQKANVSTLFDAKKRSSLVIWRRSNIMLGCFPSLDYKSDCNYIVAMKTRIIRIGNSQGVRIPKLYLQQTGLAEEVELEVHDSEIVIRSAEHPRQNWAEAFRQMAKHGEDKLLDEESINQSSWDETEWRW